MSNGLVVSDADALIALVHTEDANHAKAVAISTKLLEKGVTIILPNTAILEAITSLKRALNLPEKSALLNTQYQQGVFVVEYINEDIQMLSSKYYKEAISKKNTAFDAVVAATAKELNADAIFSFDQWYTKLGFTLASDFAFTS